MFEVSLAQADEADPRTWPDDRFDMWVDSLIAADPGEQVPAEALGAPIERDLIGHALLGVRARNLGDAAVATAVAGLLSDTPPAGPLTPRSLVAAEIGAALALGSVAALKLVDTVVALTRRLPLAWAAVQSGDLEWGKARLLAETTGPLTDAQAAAVDACVAPAAGRSWARYADAVRRAVVRVDPEGADARRRQARRDVALIRSHHGDGMGALFSRMPSEQLDTVWTAADLWARGRKAEGDARNLDQLRVGSLVQWAQSFLHHGDPTYCDRWCTPGSHDRVGPESTQPEAPEEQQSDADDDSGEGDDNGGAAASARPMRHGRHGALHVLWDLASLLGLADSCGELSDSGAVLPPAAMRELVAGGVTLRRLLIDPDNGEALDLTPAGWALPRTVATELDVPVVLTVVCFRPTWQAIAEGTADQALLAAVSTAPAAVRAMLAAAETASHLDSSPDVYRPTARMAEFIAVRDRHPVNPSAGPTAASAADIDHLDAFAQGGRTVRDQLASLVRRWHRLKTFGGWQLRRVDRHWEWTSPRGRTYRADPYDYRLGP